MCNHTFFHENGYKNKETLKFYYNELNYTITEIAKILKCGYGTVRRWMIKHEIPIKSTTEHLKGKPSWNKGLTKNINTGVKKISEAKMGNKNPMWKGDDVKYEALHTWIKRHKPRPITCEICNNNTPYDLANISGEYKRDVNDFQWLCRKCHMISDNRMNNRNEKGQWDKK